MPSTPRERVLQALAHEQPDRVPCDFWAGDLTWEALFRFAGHRDTERLLRDFAVDIRGLDAVSPADTCTDGVYQNFWGERHRLLDTPLGPMKSALPGALSGATTLAELEAFPWPKPEDFDYSLLPKQIEQCGEHALRYGFCDLWQRPSLVRGLESMYVEMAEQPEWVDFLIGKFVDFYVEDYTRAAEVSNGRFDLYLVISDLGSQSGPLISLGMFRRFVAPALQTMCDLIHSFGAKAMFHSCGNMAAFIPDLIALGVDVLDPIQPCAPEMQPARLSAAFGDRLCFHGGIDVQRLLPSGSPAEVREAVERECRLLGVGGGYILGPAHLFQPDTPPANIQAFYEANRVCGDQ